MNGGRLFWIGLIICLFLAVVVAADAMSIGLEFSPSEAEALATHWKYNSENHTVYVNVTPNETATCNVTATLSGLVFYNASMPDTVYNISIGQDASDATYFYVNASTRGNTSITYSVACNYTNQSSNQYYGTQTNTSYMFVDVLDLSRAAYNGTYFIDNYTHFTINVTRYANSNLNLSSINITFNGTDAGGVLRMVACDPPELNGDNTTCFANSTFDFGHIANGTLLEKTFYNISAWVVDAAGDFWNQTNHEITVWPNPYFVLNESTPDAAVNISDSWLIRGRPGNLTVNVFKLGGANAEISVEGLANSSLQVTNCTISELNSTVYSCQLLLNATDAGEGIELNLTAFGPAMNATYRYQVSSFETASLVVYNISNTSLPILETSVELGAQSTGSATFYIWINETSNNAALKNVTFDYTPFTNGTDTFAVGSSLYSTIASGVGENVGVAITIPNNAAPGRYSSTLTVGAFNSNQTQDITVWVNVTPTVKCEIVSSSLSTSILKPNPTPDGLTINVNSTGNAPITSMAITERTGFDSTFALRPGDFSYSGTLEFGINASAGNVRADTYSDTTTGTHSSTITLNCSNPTFGSSDSSNFFSFDVLVNATASSDDGGGSSGGGSSDLVTSSSQLSLVLIDTSTYPSKPDVYQGSTAKFKTKVCNMHTSSMSKVEVNANAQDSGDSGWEVDKVTFTNLASSTCSNDILKIDVPKDAKTGEHNFTLEAQRIGVTSNKPTAKVRLNVLKKPVVKTISAEAAGNDNASVAAQSGDGNTTVSVKNNTLLITLAKKQSGNVSATIAILDGDGKMMYNYTRTYFFESDVESMVVDLPSTLNGTYSIAVTVTDQAGAIIGEKSSTLAITPLKISKGDAEKSGWWVYGLYGIIIGGFAAFIGLWIYSGEMPLKKVIEEGSKRLPQIKIPRKEKDPWKQQQKHYYGPASTKKTVVSEPSQKVVQEELALIKKIEELEIAAREAYQRGQHSKGRQLANNVKELMGKLERLRAHGNS